MKVPVKLYTSEEIAEVLRVNPRTVTRMLQAGEIPAVIDRPALKRFDLGAVLEALASKELAAPPNGPRTISEVCEANGRGRRVGR